MHVFIVRFLKVGAYTLLQNEPVAHISRNEKAYRFESIHLSVIEF